MLTHLPPFTGSMSWSLYRLLVQIGCGLNEQPSAEWMVSAPSRPIMNVPRAASPAQASTRRSEEHTSELQSLMRISYAVFCLKKKKKNTTNNYTSRQHFHTHSNNDTTKHK